MSCNNNNFKEKSTKQATVTVSDYPQEVTFPSLDGLQVSANVYQIDTTAPVIVLCHQARFNKFEYAGIAKKLNKMGFNCIAIDQRSGGPISIMPNETKVRAVEQKKPTDYLDAEQDIIAAINYAVKRYHKPIILWGSSYSSTLALYIAADNKNVKAVIAFSPGNYFTNDKGSLIKKLAHMKKPLFITSSKSEAGETKELFKDVNPDDFHVYFEPSGEGHHGSKALWNTQQDSNEYWLAIGKFLNKIGN
jgi:dienelactone hydrolase